MSKTKEWGEIEPSIRSMGTINKIRDIVDRLDMNKINKNKSFITVSIGDPTRFPNLKPAPNAVQAIQKSLESGKWNGYAPSFGYDEPRKALAKKYSYPNNNVTLDDIFLTSGCSDAINIAMCALLNENDSILLPQPGFSLYETLCGRYGFNPIYYRLLPDKDWDIDIKYLQEQIQKSKKKPKCILINNPNNPCGSVLSKQNLLNTIEIANQYQIPMIVDEIYAAMVFKNSTFYPLASLSSTVPIISVGGIAKEYLAPGWRLGWIIVYDQKKKLMQVKEAMRKLTTVILGPNTLIQGALSDLLFETPQSYFDELCLTLENNANVLSQSLTNIKGVKPIPAKGAMYLMVKIEIENFDPKDIKNDVDFAAKLLEEESVLVLPGQIFGMPNYFRCVTCPPPEIMKQVGQRVSEFCKRHRINPKKSSKL